MNNNNKLKKDELQDNTLFVLLNKEYPSHSLFKILFKDHKNIQVQVILYSEC